jgi:aldehyde dehydrogenase (NAD+)
MTDPQPPPDAAAARTATVRADADRAAAAGADVAGDAAGAPTHQLYIGGEWIDGVAGERFESRNPADWSRVVGRFQAGGPADVAMAVRVAEEALPAWRTTPAPERAEILFRFGSLLAQHHERLAQAISRETGNILPEARGEVQAAIDVALLIAGEGRRLFGETVPSELADTWTMSIRQPLGVAAVITPRSSPIAIPSWKLLPALVAGNAVVFKPATDTPHCATLLVELMAEAGFPPGTVNLVTGSAGAVGDALVESRDVQVISFTGRTSTGRTVATRAGRLLKRVALALGGKNAAAVMADADLDLAAEGILGSAFGATGQRCTACSRVVVERAVLDPLLERLESGARALRLGPGLDAATDVGPLINQAALGRVAEYVEIGRTEGELICGGHAATAGDLARGWFFEPTIFSGVMPMARIAQEEIFGPVLSVIPVDGYDEVVRAVNGVRSGLCSSIYTRDVNTAFRAVRDFETALVNVNTGPTGAALLLPIGGWKESGNGHRAAGRAALDEFTAWKSIRVDFSGGHQGASMDERPA